MHNVRFTRHMYMRFTDFIKLLLLITNALFYLNIAICIAFIFVSATGGYDDILSDILQYKETSSGSLGEVNSERVGIVLQVISGVMCSIVAFVSSFITIQNNDFLGIKYVDIWKLRKNFHLSLKQYLVVSILFVTANLFCFLQDLWSWCIGIAASSLWFTIFFIFSEFKYADLTEKNFIEILRNYLLWDFQRQNKNSKKCYEEVKDNTGSEVISKYLQKKELRVVLKNFSIPHYSKYNIFILTTLVNLISNISNKLYLIQDPLLKEDQYNMVRNSLHYLLENDIIESETEKFITNQVIYSLRNLFSIDEYKDDVAGQLIDILKNYESNNSNINIERVFIIVLDLVINNIKINNFDLIMRINDDLSGFGGDYLNKNKNLKRFYMLLSFFLYSLTVNKIVPPKIKNSVFEFLNYKNESAKSLSWHDLFSNFIRNFDLSLDDFINDVIKNEHRLEYFPPIIQVITPIISENFAITWYASVFLNQTNYQRIYTEILPVKSEKIKSYLSYFARKFIQHNQTCISIDKESDLYKMAKFMAGENQLFPVFRIKEYREKIREYFNKIVMKDNEQFENNFNKDKELQKLECSINAYLHNIFDIQDNTLIKQHIIQSQNIRKSFNAEYACLHFYKDTISELLVEQIKIFISEHSLQVKESNFDKVLASLRENLDQDTIDDQSYILGDQYNCLLCANNTDKFEEVEKIILNLNQNKFKGSGLPIFVFNNGVKLSTCLNIEALPLQINEIENEVNKYASVDGFYSYKDALLSKEQLYEIISKNSAQFIISFTFWCEVDEKKVISFYNEFK